MWKKETDLIEVILDYAAKWWLEWLFGLVAAAFICYIRSVKKKQSAFEVGLQALLRAEIIKSYDKYSERGTITLHGLEAVNLMYESYHALGGNGTITTLMGNMKELPVQMKAEEVKT